VAKKNDTVYLFYTFIYYLHYIYILLIYLLVGIALSYGLEIGVLGFDSWRMLGIIILTAASRPALGPTQPPIHWVSEALSLGVKWPGSEADHSLPSSAEVKIPGAIPPFPQYVFMAWCLVKHRDNFTEMGSLN
jgi:hypothetical protein